MNPPALLAILNMPWAVALGLFVFVLLVLFGVLAIGGLLVFLHFRRQNLLRHKERMEMIQHGIDPDYAPDDVDPALQQTNDHPTG